MIAILSISKENYCHGEQWYQININSEIIAIFTHNFEDGLAVCLEKAAEAVKEVNSA